MEKSHDSNLPYEQNDVDSHEPSQMEMLGHDFSPEDIQDLLGCVLDNNQLTGGNPSASSEEGIDSKEQARTERKRFREKQRRSDVNKQFTELTSTLRKMEGSSTNSYSSCTPSNRADLIARSISLLSNLDESNKRQKLEIGKLKEELELAKKAGEDTAAKLKESMMGPHNVGGNKVIMMVPMMIGGGPNGAQGAMPMPFLPNAAAAAGSTSTMPWMNVGAASNMMPWMNMMMTPNPPPANASTSTENNNSNSNDSTNNDEKLEANNKKQADAGNIGSNLAHCA